MPNLIESYLIWKYVSSTETPAPATPTTFDFDINILDLYTLKTTAHITQDADSPSVADALMKHGLVGSTPISPTLAVSVRTLELYRQLRKRKLSFSGEAFAKVVCDLYKVSVQ
jgi:hypothetical protein